MATDVDIIGGGTSIANAPTKDSESKDNTATAVSEDSADSDKEDTVTDTDTDTNNEAEPVIDTAPFHLLDLPPELRIRIYHAAVVVGITLYRPTEPNLMHVSKQLRTEVGDEYYNSNIFKFGPSTLTPLALRQFRRQAGSHVVKTVMVLRDVHVGFHSRRREWLRFEVKLSSLQTVQYHAESPDKLVVMGQDATFNQYFTRELCLCGLQRMASSVTPGRHAVLDFMDLYVAHVYHSWPSDVMAICAVCGAGASP